MNKLPKRIIFCDYDSVLNDPVFLRDIHSKPGQHLPVDCLDPKRITLLAMLCNQVKAEVVLTSSWRDDLSVRPLLKRAGIKIAGATPHKFDHRGKEIQQWLRDSKFKGEWIIIDDECSDLYDWQQRRLVCTREGNNLGLQFKHIGFADSLFEPERFYMKADTEFISVVLEGISYELTRVMENRLQSTYSSPFDNSGNVQGFKCDTFEAHAYNWGWDAGDPKGPEPVNFKWRDFKVWWYKYLGRGMETNRTITHDELALMYKECVEALREIERKADEVI